jgi:hypothetical protein
MNKGVPAESKPPFLIELVVPICDTAVPVEKYLITYSYLIKKAKLSQER